jgi:predicted transposase YbfD/YdcC
VSLVLEVKGNQKGLEQAFDDIFISSNLQNESKNKNENTYGTQEQSHGRSETRLHKVSHDIDALGDIALEWLGKTTLGYVVSLRKTGNEPSKHPLISYYISSAKLSVKELAHAAREHWSIEVNLHWKLDVACKRSYLSNSTW